jgi:hypothetical protein
MGLRLSIGGYVEKIEIMPQHPMSYRHLLGDSYHGFSWEGENKHVRWSFNLISVWCCDPSQKVSGVKLGRFRRAKMTSEPPGVTKT